MSKRRRVLAFIIALAVIIGLVSSAVFAVAKSDHECTGENCQICLSIQQNLKSFDNQSLDSAGISVSVTALLALVLVIGAGRSSAKPETLISLKAKLSD